MGIKLAWYFPFLSHFLGSEISKVTAHQRAFLTHSIVFPCGIRSLLFFFLYFLGLGGGLSWGNCPLNSKWRCRKTMVMGCVVLRAECCLAISPLVLQCAPKLCLIWICPSLWLVMGLVNLLSTFPFPSFLSLEASCAGAVSLWMF